MEQLVAFAAALLALRLAGALASRWRASRRPELAAWSAALLSYAAASAALAWGAAAGWDDRVFRVYYLFGGLLSAPLLGTGSLLLARMRWIAPLALVYVGLAVGVAVAVPLTHPVAGVGVPDAGAHLHVFPARALAIAANSVGTLAVVAVALWTIKNRLVGNVLLLAGVSVAAIGSGTSLGEAGTAALLATGALLLYAGFVSSRMPNALRRLLTRGARYRLTR